MKLTDHQVVVRRPWTSMSNRKCSAWKDVFVVAHDSASLKSLMPRVSTQAWLTWQDEDGRDRVDGMPHCELETEVDWKKKPSRLLLSSPQPHRGTQRHRSLEVLPNPCNRHDFISTPFAVNSAHF
jgi:hypothetical protein